MNTLSGIKWSELKVSFFNDSEKSKSVHDIIMRKRLLKLLHFNSGSIKVFEINDYLASFKECPLSIDKHGIHFGDKTIEGNPGWILFLLLKDSKNQLSLLKKVNPNFDLILDISDMEGYKVKSIIDVFGNSKNIIQNDLKDKSYSTVRHGTVCSYSGKFVYKNSFLSFSEEGESPKGTAWDIYKHGGTSQCFTAKQNIIDTADLDSF